MHFDNTIYEYQPFRGRPSSLAIVNQKIWDELRDKAVYKFTAIDWRTDFGGTLYGDQYYDLAKMLGGLFQSYKDIKSELYSYKEENDYATIEVPHITDVAHYEEKLRLWVEANGLNWRKVQLLVPIIYLNMSPLHEAPFDKFLVALSQYHFSKVLD